MDAERRWLEITSAFNADTMPKTRAKPNKLNPNPIIEAQTGTATETPTNIAIVSRNNETNGHPTGSKSSTRILIQELQNKIEALNILVEQKSQIIVKQEEIISSLEKKLNLISNQIENIPPAGNMNKDFMPKNRSTNEKFTFQKILQSITELETRMSKFASSLPQKIHHFCDQYMSHCKFHLIEECGSKFFVIVGKDNEESCKESATKPIWQREPTIKPQFNNCSKARQRSHQLDANNNQINSNSQDFHLHLTRLEKVVNDLKINFVQVLLDKFKPQSDCQQKK